MKTKLILALLVLGSSVSANAQVFGRNADAGAVVGGIVGAVIGHNNGQKVWRGAAIGAGVGLVAGAIADNHTYHTSGNHQPVYQETYSSYDDYYDRDFYPSYGQVVVRQAPPRVIVVQEPPPRVVVIHRPTPVYTYPNYTYVQHPIRGSAPCVVQNNHHRTPNYTVNNRPPANNYRPPANNHPRDNRRDDRRDHDRRR